MPRTSLVREAMPALVRIVAATGYPEIIMGGVGHETTLESYFLSRLDAWERFKCAVPFAVHFTDSVVSVGRRLRESEVGAGQGA